MLYEDFKMSGDCDECKEEKNDLIWLGCQGQLCKSCCKKQYPQLIDGSESE